MKDKEQARLEKLALLNILDSEPEPVFDSITRIAATLTSTPISAVSLMDARRQWFKSRYGLSITETPREISFCNHVIATGEELVVEDAANDHRFSHNALVTSDPNIRFYASVPLKSIDGHALGTLLVIDTQPKNKKDTPLNTLQDLATIASQELQHRERLAHATQSAKILKHQFKTLFEHPFIGMAVVDIDGRWSKVNQALCKIVGYTKQELTQLTFQHITHPDDLDADLNLLFDLVMGKIDHYRLEKRYLKKNGEVVWIELSVTKQLNTQGQVEYFNVIVKDIHQSKLTEQALDALRASVEQRIEQRTVALKLAHESLMLAYQQKIQSEHLLQDNASELRTILDNANDAYVCMDKFGIVTAWNKQAESTFGWTEDEAIGKALHQLIIPEEVKMSAQSGLDSFELLMQPRSGKRMEIEAVRKDGLRIPIEFQINAIQTNRDTLYTAFLRDITARKSLEQLLQNEAHNDVLTGLPNRRKLEEVIPAAMMQAQQQRLPLSILFIDLDGFKSVNDTYGHTIGDLLLRSMAQRINRNIRKSDIVARYGGDEFVILLDCLEKSKNVTQIAHKLLNVLSKPLQIADTSVCVTASIGIATFSPSHLKILKPTEMIKMADEAMYMAKNNGKNGFYELFPKQTDA